MKKSTDVTYGQLDRALRSLGFSYRFRDGDPPARVYEQKETGAIVMLPPFPEKERVYDYHLAGVRATLDVFGIADPIAFAAELQKAG